MKLFRKTISVILVFAMLFAFAACGAKEEGETEPAPLTTESDEREVKTKVAALFGPTGIGLAKLKADRGYGYEVEYYSDPQEIVPLLVQGSADIAALPVNLAANLYKKTQGGIQILAINTLGILHVLQRGDKTVESIADLKGKTVYMTGEGSTPQYTVEYVLRQNGIDPAKDVDIVYAGTHGELAAMALEGKADICILPEPFATKVLYESRPHDEAENSAEETTEEKDTSGYWHRVLDVTKEWDKVSDCELALGCIVARKEYIEQNPDIIKEFMTFNEVSVNWVNIAEDAPVLLVEQGFFTDLIVAKNALPGCNIVFIEGEQMKATAQANFEILYEASPASVGGEIPDEGIYYLG